MLFLGEWGRDAYQITEQAIAEKAKRRTGLLKDFISSMQKTAIDITNQSFYFLDV